MSDNRGGVLSFVFDGEAYTLEGSASFSTQRFMRSSVQGLTGPAGHKREPTQPYIEVTVFDGSAVDLEALQGRNVGTAQLDLYNGKQVVLYDAVQVGMIEPDAAEGTFTLRLEGPRGRVFAV
jgi:hypothetical protein